MKLIIGLGNPGPQYQNNRHNVGHGFVSKLKIKNQKAKMGGAKILKTTVFVNESGKEVKEIISNFQFPISNLLIVHDDMDFPFGKYKLKFGRSSAGHKGVRSIIDALGTQDFWRLRIGIGKPPEGIGGDKYVLSDFSEEEREIIVKVFEEAIGRLKEWIRVGS